MDDILKEFLVESYENLDRLDRDLVVLEKDPHSTETLGSIFRTIHTLKGTSGFLGFGKLEAVAHVGENLLSKMRDGVITINPDIASALLATVDAVRLMLGEIEKTGQPGEKDFSELVQRLTQLNEGTNPSASEAIPAAPGSAAVETKVSAGAPAPAPAPIPNAVPAPAPASTPVAAAASAPAPAKG